MKDLCEKIWYVTFHLTGLKIQGINEFTDSGATQDFMKGHQTHKKAFKEAASVGNSETFDLGEFNEFEPCLKSPKDRFQLSAGLNFETLNTILSGTNHIWAAS